MAVVVAGCSSQHSVAADSVPISRPLSAQPGTLAMSPAPGSRTASPQTQISLRGPGSADAELTVTGSKSGPHTGSLRPHSDGQGASFVPDQPFVPGETVTVRTTAPIRGSHDGRTSFVVARPAVETTPPKPVVPTTTAGPAPRTDTFTTEPALRVPHVSVSASSAPAAGDVLLATKGGGLPSALQIVDSRGGLVWYQAAPTGQSVNDLQAQTFDQHQVLSYWVGSQNVNHGYGDGEVVLLDSAYRQVRTVRAGNGYHVDLHDFQIVGDTAWLTVYAPIRWDLRPVGGKSDGIVIDGVVQAVDLNTGLVEFEWHSLDHIPLSASTVHPPHDSTTAWDYVHVNSIDIHGDHLLVSARHTDAVYRVDSSNGDVEWTLGGNQSTFRLAPGARFGFQHDVRELADGSITVFDDGGGPPRVEKQSRALMLRLDLADKTASVVISASHSPPIVANSQGNVQRLPDGHLFVGWGSAPDISEYDASGLVWDAQLPAGVSSYRAYRVTWPGAPHTSPLVVAHAASGSTRVAVSWNGDTRTARWRFSAATPAGVVRRTVARAGFETVVTLPVGARSVTVQALDAHGRVIATARTAG